MPVQRLPDLEEFQRVYLFPDNRGHSRMTTKDDKILKSTGKFLNAGGFGWVFLVENHSEHGRVAAKYIARVPGNEKMLEKSFERETKALLELQHKNIVKIFAFSSMERHFEILMEYCERGSLKDVVLDPKIVYSMKTVLTWAEQLFDALAFVHEKGIVHRDLKMANILVTNDFLLKVGDFGSVRNLTTVNSITFVGTPLYMSPEQFNGKCLSSKSDVYSASLVLWELIERRCVFMEYEETPYGLFNDLQNGKCFLSWALCEHPIVLLIDRCLSLDESSRPTSRQVYETFRIFNEKYDDSAFTPEIVEDQKKTLRPIGFDKTLARIPINCQGSIGEGPEPGDSILPPNITFTPGETSERRSISEKESILNEVKENGSSNVEKIIQHAKTLTNIILLNEELIDHLPFELNIRLRVSEFVSRLPKVRNPPKEIEEIAQMLRNLRDINTSATLMDEENFLIIPGFTDDLFKFLESHLTVDLWFRELIFYTIFQRTALKRIWMNLLEHSREVKDQIDIERLDDLRKFYPQIKLVDFYVYRRGAFFSKDACILLSIEEKLFAKTDFSAVKKLEGDFDQIEFFNLKAGGTLILGIMAWRRFDWFTRIGYIYKQTKKAIMAYTNDKGAEIFIFQLDLCPNYWQNEVETIFSKEQLANLDSGYWAIRLELEFLNAKTNYGFIDERFTSKSPIFAFLQIRKTDENGDLWVILEIPSIQRPRVKCLNLKRMVIFTKWLELRDIDFENPIMLSHYDLWEFMKNRYSN